IVDVGGASYIDLFHVSLGAEPSSGPQVRAFGAKVIRNNGGGNQWHPHDANSNFDALNTAIECPTGLSQGIWWRPLYNPTTGAHLQSFLPGAAEIGIESTANGTEYRTGQVTYFTAGCDIVVILPCLEPDNLGSNPDQLVVGQFG